MASGNPDIQRRKSSVALLSVASNATLVAAKLGIGMLIGSVSVISEAIHSGVDLVAAVIAWFAVRTSGKPADRQHPYGHGKIENISGTVEALLIFVAAGWIIYESVNKLLHNEPLDAPALGVAVMFVSAAANFFVSSRLFKVGRETDSVALQADAWHLRTDVWTSLGVMAGLAVILAGRWLFPGVNLDWLDPVAAILVAALIIHAAWKLTVESGRDLMDASLLPRERAWIRAYIRAFQPRIRGFHQMRSRKSGPSRFLEFHLIVDGRLSVFDSHSLAGEIKAGIVRQYPGTTVTIHVEPCKECGCSNSCEEGCTWKFGPAGAPGPDESAGR
jgi:cation diffusion facilitator family transporter